MILIFDGITWFDMIDDVVTKTNSKHFPFTFYESINVRLFVNFQQTKLILWTYKWKLNEIEQRTAAVILQLIEYFPMVYILIWPGRPHSTALFSFPIVSCLADRIY